MDHKVYVILGFHTNFYHSWRGDTPDEAGFGTDIRIVREILRMLNNAGEMAKAYWDTDVYYTFERIIPQHAPDILEGIRATCREDFNLSIRLSPERFGMQLAEVRELVQELIAGGLIDFLDMSLWDVRKEPVEEKFQGRTLMSYFTELDRGGVRLGAAGKIYDAETARWCLDEGCDFVIIGRGAILHADFPIPLPTGSYKHIVLIHAYTYISPGPGNEPFCNKLIPSINH